MTLQSYKERKLNKWYFRLSIQRDYLRGKGKVFAFGIYKLISFPPEACMLTEQNYKGFLIIKYFSPRNPR